MNLPNKLTIMRIILVPFCMFFIAFNFSGMLGVYWIYQSALGILQTYILSKVMPLPKYSEEQLKELKKNQKEAEKQARTAAKNAPKVRSLHYIDDDDYESLPEMNVEQKKEKKDLSGIDIPDIKD